MAKTKTPFFSIDSRGTVGGSLTTQKRGSATLLRSKPVPTDPYSLAQAYQRWDYKDYAYLWTLLSNSEKQVYRTTGSRYHLTGFSYWMRLRLKELTNLVARWHLDEKVGAIAYDSSKNNNNGTIFGASPTSGIIDGAYYFDGLNDYISCPIFPQTEDGTLLFWLKPASIIPNMVFLSSRALAISPGSFQIYETASKLGCLVWLPPWGWRINFNTTTLLIPDTPLYIAYTWNHISGWKVYVNGLYENADTDVASLFDGASPLTIAANQIAMTGFSNTVIDQVSFYDRTLNPTEILRHSQRRYP